MRARIVLEEDTELRLITQRKLAQMKKRAQAVEPQKAEKSDPEVVRGMLFDRGDEVLDAAYAAFPRDTEAVVKELARLVRSGRLNEKVSGGELYSFFRNIGMRFSINTTIKVEEKGKLVDISEKFRGTREGE